MKDKKETIAQKAYRLLKPIPFDKWVTGKFTNGIDKCCLLGHYKRVTSINPKDYSAKNCTFWFAEDNEEVKILEEEAADFLEKYHKETKEKSSYLPITRINNFTNVNGYIQKTIKGRGLKLLSEMIEAGY